MARRTLTGGVVLISLLGATLGVNGCMAPIEGIPATSYLRTKAVAELARAPLRAVQRVRLEVPQEELFAFVSDTQTLLEWMPGLEGIESLDHTESERTGRMDVGSVRRLRFGFTDVERIVLWEPPRGYAYSIVGGAPVRDHLAVITIEPVLNGRAAVMTWYQYFHVERRSLMGWFMPLRVPGFIETAVDNLITEFGGERLAADELKMP